MPTRTAGKRALNKAMAVLAKNQIRFAAVIGAFFPEMIRKAKDAVSEAGLTDCAKWCESSRVRLPINRPVSPAGGPREFAGRRSAGRRRNASTVAPRVIVWPGTFWPTSPLKRYRNSGGRFVSTSDIEGPQMKPRDPKSMTVNELWALHLEIKSALASRIAAEKTKLEKQLKQLESDGTLNEIPRAERRPYPRVLPKYQNPAEPKETWAGRGKQPRWLVAQIKSGKELEDFRDYTVVQSHA
jgi:DNA-binding protein H-NS